MFSSGTCLPGGIPKELNTSLVLCNTLVSKGNTNIAIFRCGNVGHYAEVCASAERLCYNCEYILKDFQ